MADPIFEHPRLAAIYDALESDRADLAAYLAMAEEFAADTVLDIGCGTGTLALSLAASGRSVIGVDPAAATLRVARTKPGAGAVRWLRGDATTLPSIRADLATMTGNVAQAITDPADWSASLRGIHTALRPGGRLVFETRDPAFRGWREWNRADSHRVTEIAGVGEVQSWVELLTVHGPLVRFRWTWVFAADGEVLTSDSTLRFRERAEVAESLRENGFRVDEVRDAPDRPGREFVFLAARPE
ncbi:class I SAM-dependent methyltransferase [Sciscionella marina]|uniref:class I SAM-dependent methyltransferase n=1 Tax=Sciscionella marina TaxID=508770 RepID=UPI00036BB5E0|nr:class I SAM-dependent methyltransferase [Sciscionella marina]